MPLLFAQSPTVTSTSYGPVQVNSSFPTFRGWSLDGNSVGLSSFQKISQDNSPDIVIVSYFATWCAPCRKGIPIIEKVSSDKDITAIYISIDAPSDEAKLQKFRQEIHIDNKNPIIWDKFKKIAERHGVIQTTNMESQETGFEKTKDNYLSIPKTFVIRPDGTVETIFIEEGIDFEEQLQNSILSIKKTENRKE
jgi:thiol-disulfide isomerase/thioredoxin